MCSIRPPTEEEIWKEKLKIREWRDATLCEKSHIIYNEEIKDNKWTMAALVGGGLLLNSPVYLAFGCCIPWATAFRKEFQSRISPVVQAPMSAN